MKLWNGYVLMDCSTLAELCFIICPSETSVDIHRTTQRYMPEGRSILHSSHCNNLRSNIELYGISYWFAEAKLSLALISLKIYNITRIWKRFRYCEYLTKHREIYFLIVIDYVVGISAPLLFLKQSIFYLMILMGKPEGKRPLERPRRRWNDNIKMKWNRMWRYELDSSGSG
jgi:hypothetical protein